MLESICCYEYSHLGHRTKVSTRHPHRNTEPGAEVRPEERSDVIKEGVVVLIYLFFFYSEFYRNQNWLTHVDR